ncbi:MAG: EthD family reductase [Nevskiales bacterium]|nr:EthD family reductase [Nevskiales bacterium]
MYCVTVAYPRREGGTFDFDYYTGKHIPLVAGHAGDNVVKAEIRKGFAAPDGSAPAFVCMANFWVKSPEAFQAMLAQHGAEIIGDVANFTNLQPVMQIDEILVPAA